jgi:F420-non-reducing hydrogenase iron-sulfur subunit
MFHLTEELVHLLGIAPGRLRLEWVSSAEGIRFAEIMREFSEQIESLGPAGLKKVA